MNPDFSAVLLAGGKSRRMGHDKILLQVNGVPLWRRQLRMLYQVGLTKIFVAGPPRPEWVAAGLEVVRDAEGGFGPFAGLVATLRLCPSPFLLALAVDLPQMNAAYLKSLLEACTPGTGVIPSTHDRFEPLAAVYPVATLPSGERLLQLGRFSLQDFSASCVAQGLMTQRCVAPEEEALFFNLNTPEDLHALSNSPPSA